MISRDIISQLLSLYFVSSLVFMGFFCFLIFDGSNAEGKLKDEFIIVDCNGFGDYTSIQTAINQAGLGYTIYVWDGEYNEVIRIDKNVNLIGNGTGKTIINGGSDDWNIVTITSDYVVFKGFTVTGYAANWMTAGICLNNVDYCRIENNNCSNIKITNGIRLRGSNYNLINNNTCLENDYSGIDLFYSYYNNITNNICKFNKVAGFHMYDSVFRNIFENNIVSNNNYGIQTSYSVSFPGKDNIFLNNNISFNSDHGIYIQDGYSNSFYNNNICYNSGYGILIENGDSNRFFHNNIINNTVQAYGSGDNYWEDGYCEGNYWSDYLGEDNGAKNRLAGDGIGDTKLPHLTLDSYPFIEPNGWLELDTPILFDPEVLNNKGNYAISWSSSPRAKNYILEEVNDFQFNSAKIVFNGSNLSCSFINKDNGTYYYRVRACNNYTISPWSNIVELTVDWFPVAPIDLTASNITAHEVTLNWSFVDEPDIQGYYVLRTEPGSDPEGPYHRIMNVSSTINQVTIDDLDDDANYYFAVVAFDKVKNNSTYSNIVSVTTLDIIKPRAPIGISAEAISGSEILIEWIGNSELDVVGYNIFMNDSNNGVDGTFHLITTISKNKLSTIISNLEEEVTYYFKLQAFDEVPNYSPFSETISATTLDETPPQAPTGVRISDRTHNSLIISWDANPEPDVVGYIVYKTITLSSTMLPVNPLPLKTTHLEDSDLEEITTYYYKVKAMDDVGLISEFSKIVNGTTLYSPRSPEINKSVSDVILKEDTPDNHSLNLYQIFKDLNNDELMFWCTGQEHINVTINQNNGSVTLMPEHDWNGEDIVTFYASDGSNEIYDIIKIIVKPVNDRPRFVEILSPKNGLKIEEGALLDFVGNCIDPDVEYGDVLTYFWSSNLTGDLGQGAKLYNIRLPPGKHRITLTVFDKQGKFGHEFIKINVLEKTHSKPADDGNYILAVVMGIVVLVILLLFILLIIKKKLSGEIIEKEDKPVVPEYEGIIRSNKAIDSTITIVPLKTTEVSILDRYHNGSKYAEIYNETIQYNQPTPTSNGEPINVIRLRNSELKQMKYPENYF